jgi:hypothetical protein
MILETGVASREDAVDVIRVINSRLHERDSVESSDSNDGLCTGLIGFIIHGPDVHETIDVSIVYVPKSCNIVFTTSDNIVLLVSWTPLSKEAYSGSRACIMMINGYP